MALHAPRPRGRQLTQSSSHSLPRAPLGARAAPGSRCRSTTRTHKQRSAVTARFSVATPSDEELWRSRDDAQPLKRLNVLEGAVDDPLLANPRQRHERLGTGWYGVIFEFEGVLVPSAHEDHMQAWREVCSTYGKSPPFFLLERAEGMKTEQVISEVLHLSRNPEMVRQIADAKEAAFQRIHGTDARPEPMPGAVSLLRSLAFNDIPIAVASATRGDALMESLQRAGLASYCAAVISGDDVAAGRPDPEPYLRAAYDIGRPPARCVVVGASNGSIEAAADVGARCIAVASRLKVYELTAADLVVRQLEELRLQNFQQLFGEEAGREPEYQLEEEAETSSSTQAVAVADDGGGHSGSYPF